jgi:hypothetical protein
MNNMKNNNIEILKKLFHINIKVYFEDAIINFTSPTDEKIDIYIPSKNIGINVSGKPIAYCDCFSFNLKHNPSTLFQVKQGENLRKELNSLLLDIIEFLEPSKEMKPIEVDTSLKLICSLKNYDTNISYEERMKILNKPYENMSFEEVVKKKKLLEIIEKNTCN